MGAYEYTALDDGGRERKGVLEGDTPRQIRQLLRDKGWAPLKVAEVAQRERERNRGISPFRGGASPADICLLYTSRCV